MRRQQLPFFPVPIHLPIHIPMPIPFLHNPLPTAQDSCLVSWSFILCDDHRINFTKFHTSIRLAGWSGQKREEGWKFCGLPLQLIRRPQTLRIFHSDCNKSDTFPAFVHGTYAQYLPLGTRPRNKVLPAFRGHSCTCHCAAKYLSGIAIAVVMLTPQAKWPIKCHHIAPPTVASCKLQLVSAASSCPLSPASSFCARHLDASHPDRFNCSLNAVLSAHSGIFSWKDFFAGGNRFP